VALPKKLEPIGPIARRTNADDSVDIVDREGTIVVSGTIDGGVSQSAFDALSATVTSQGVTLASLGITVSGHTTSISALNASVASNSTAIGVLQGTVSSLSTTVAGHTTTLAAYDTWLDDLDSDYGTLTAAIAALGGSGGSAEDISGTTEDGTTDNSVAIRNTVGPAGTAVTAKLSRLQFGKVGGYMTSAFVDLAPSISLEMSARGGKLLIPDDNLPDITTDFDGITDTSVGHVYGGGAYGAGAPGALLRLARLTPSSSLNLAFQQELSGFNIDARGTTQTNAWIGIRSPNPDNSENAEDGDPLYSGNKDYTAPHFVNGDIIGCPGTGYRGEAGNGRLAIDSFRFLSNGGLDESGNNHGVDSSGNDVVVYGHSAAGSNKGYGFKWGAASGLLMVTTNMWGNPSTRSAACGAMWFNGRRSFAVGFCVINDVIRFDGASNYQQGGVFCANSYATHDENFESEGVAINILADGDKRCQANNTVGGYRVLNFVGNMYSRTTKVLFDTWQNVGGALDGKFGTAYQWLYDAHDEAAFNTLDQINTGPNCKPWTGNTGTFTASGATITSTAHGLQDGTRLALYTSANDLPAGLFKGITYFVVGSATNTFGLAYTPGGTAITTTDAGTGTHTWGNLSTLPYGTRDDATVNYILQDSFHGETRIGATGHNNPGRALICIADGDEGTRSGRTGTFTFTYTSATNYTFNCTNHGLNEGDPVTLQVSAGGTLPGGTNIKTSQQYWATNCNANDFQLMDVPINGTKISVTNSAGSGTFTFSSWYRTYQVEIGNRTLHSGLPTRHALYGQWELAKSIAYQDNAWSANQLATTDVRNVSVGQAFQIISTSGGATIATATINLPTDMAVAQDLEVVFTSASITSLTWGIVSGGTGTISTSGQNLPITISGPTYVRLKYRPGSTNAWFAVVVSTDAKPFVSLGVSGTLTSNFTNGDTILVGPCTGNTTIGNPTGSTARDGHVYTWLVKQDGTGGRNISLGNKFVNAPGNIFNRAASGMTIFRATYNATDDKYYITDFQSLSGNTWSTLTGTTGAIATDCSKGKSFFIGAITGNVTISNPTNAQDDQVYTWHVLQDGTGTRTITLDTKFAKSATSFVPDTTASTATIFSARYSAANDKFYVITFQTKVS
jgi:hypothetical protein